MQLHYAEEQAFEDIGHLLTELLETHSTVTLFAPDEEGDDVRLTVVPREGGPAQVYHRDGLLTVLQAAAGAEPRKVCRRCKVEKRLEEFPRDAGRPDGRFPWCDVCNRANVRQHSRRRKAA